jgi:uncharacterized CHY-type Zn-finger protein
MTSSDGSSRQASARPEVRGVDLDAETRCAHYHSPLDIVAIKMRCCGDYYACKDCHEALAGHAIRVWPCAEWVEAAILCGACGEELSIAAYLAAGDRCPACGAPFNPGCRHHYHFYFETGPAREE